MGLWAAFLLDIYEEIRNNPLEFEPWFMCSHSISQPHSLTDHSSNVGDKRKKWASWAVSCLAGKARYSLRLLWVPLQAVGVSPGTDLDGEVMQAK